MDCSVLGFPLSWSLLRPCLLSRWCYLIISSSASGLILDPVTSPSAHPWTMHKLTIHPATLPHLPYKNALLKPLRGAQGFFRALAACLLAQPCHKPFSAPNPDVSVCLASLCIETTNFRWQHFLLKNVPVVMFLMEYYPLACFIFLRALWNISCEINASDLHEEIWFT